MSKKSKILNLILVLILSVIGHLYAQDKYEYEERISSSKVPKSALTFVDALPFNKKIKWYKEESLEGYTFEAKTKYKRKRYSVEFDKEGNLEDIEITIKRKVIPRETLQKINTYFKEKYAYHRFKKIQLQLTGEKEILQDQIRNLHQKLPRGHYEIVVKTKQGDEYQMKEYLFSPEGTAIRSSNIILENTFHLEF